MSKIRAMECGQKSQVSLLTPMLVKWISRVTSEH
jgi:hypothetical protein